MVVRCVYVIHWIGFILTLFFFTLSILDPSGDEYLIHFITSAMPLLIASLINSFVNKRMIYLPWKTLWSKPNNDGQNKTYNN